MAEILIGLLAAILIGRAIRRNRCQRWPELDPPPLAPFSEEAVRHTAAHAEYLKGSVVLSSPGSRIDDHPR